MHARNSLILGLIALAALSACSGNRARGPSAEGRTQHPPLIFPATYTELPPLRKAAPASRQKTNEVEDLLTGGKTESQTQSKPKAGSGEDALLRKF